MKKARIMLAAIAVLGIVGGTLAFKAQKYFTAGYYYTSLVNNSTYCVQGATTINPGTESQTLGFLKSSSAGPYVILNSNPVNGR